MPAPALIGAIVRGVAAAGSEVFASQAARTAATAASKGAATAAASAGTEAGAAASKAPGFVLETAPDNAKAITSALRGLSSGQAQSAAVAQTQAVQQTAPAATSASPTAPPPAPRGTAQQPTQAAPTAAQQAAQPAKQSFADRAANRAKELYRAAKEGFGFEPRKEKSVDEETRGMSLADRYKRLEQTGTLLTPQHVAKASGVPYPSQEDVVGASERAEQRERERQAKEQERAGGAGKAAMQAGGGAILSIAALPITWPFIFAKAADAVEKFGTGTLEQSRNLRRFDAAISNTFARLDRQALLLDMRKAQATGGSAAGLGRQLGDLRRELQPFRENVTIAINMIALNTVWIARGIAEVAKWSPIMKALGMWIRAMEEEQRKKNPAGPTAFDVHYQSILRGDFSGPKSERPK